MVALDLYVFGCMIHTCTVKGLYILHWILYSEVSNCKIHKINELTARLLLPEYVLSNIFRFPIPIFNPK